MSTAKIEFKLKNREVRTLSFNNSKLLVDSIKYVSTL